MPQRKDSRLARPCDLRLRDDGRPHGTESSARGGVIRVPLAADPLRQSRHAFPASGWVDEHGVVGDGANR